MIEVTYVDSKGNRQTVEAESGQSIMQVAADNLINGILGDCGGSCTCATCHCFVEEEWLEKTGEANSFEKDMLDLCAIPAKENSRLSCQITVNEDLNGIVIHLPESQL